MICFVFRQPIHVLVPSEASVPVNIILTILSRRKNWVPQIAFLFVPSHLQAGTTSMYCSTALVILVRISKRLLASTNHCFCRHHRIIYLVQRFETATGQSHFSFFWHTGLVAFHHCSSAFLQTFNLLSVIHIFLNHPEFLYDRVALCIISTSFDFKNGSV